MLWNYRSDGESHDGQAWLAFTAIDRTVVGCVYRSRAESKLGDRIIAHVGLQGAFGAGRQQRDVTSLEEGVAWCGSMLEGAG